MVTRIGWGGVAAGMAASIVLGLVGCGMQGAPQAPSLRLPEPVSGLTAERAGDRVSLRWTMPRRNTDKLLLKEEVPVWVCRRAGAGACLSVGGELRIAPGAEGAFTETLPRELATGAPQLLSYFVELKNRSGRSAGLSNAAVVVGGEAPGSVEGLTAEVRREGVVLYWANGTAQSLVRLHRKLISAESKAKAQDGLTKPTPETVEQNLLVAAGSGRALDKSIRFGQTYEYRAQRVTRLTVEGKMWELAGPQTEAVRVEAADVFPPSVPGALAAVASTEAETAIDVSWQPVADADLAGYVVYRCSADGDWARISGAEPQVAPAFHDARVQAGHTYRYAVSAVGVNGHESTRSAETQETVPAEALR